MGQYGEGEFVDDRNSTELRFGLHPAQQAIYNSTAQYKVVAAGRRFGKTILAAVECIVEGLKTENDRGVPLHHDSEVLYMAPTFEQAKGIFWPILLEWARPVTKSVHQNTGVLTLINDVRIRLKGMDDGGERARGYKLRFAVMDEYADMPASAWDKIIEPALMDTDGGALFIGTPKGQNHFYDKFMQGLTDETGIWESFNFSSRDNPAMPNAARDRLYNDPTKSRHTIEQELEANFLTLGSGDLNPEQLVFLPHEPNDGYWTVAVDLAGFVAVEKGRYSPKERLDETAIAQVKVTRRGWWIKKIEHGKWNPREVALRIVLAAKEVQAARVGIERGALMNAAMPYIEDTMRQYGTWFQIEPLTHGNQRKEERLLWALQGRLEKGRVFVNGDPETPHIKRAEWIQRFMEQLGNFPDPHAKDDLLDAVAYVDQLGGTVFNTTDMSDHEQWEPLDEIAGW